MRSFYSLNHAVNDTFEILFVKTQYGHIVKGIMRAASNPELVDVLLGWTLLGDPALVIEPR